MQSIFFIDFLYIFTFYSLFLPKFTLKFSSFLDLQFLHPSNSELLRTHAEVPSPISEPGELIVCVIIYVYYIIPARTIIV